MRLSLLALALCCALPGLSLAAVGPDYARPVLSSSDLPSAWTGVLPHDGQALSLVNWWKQFNDPLLSELIETAEQTSPSVAAAVARVAQARGAASSAGAARKPQLQGYASTNRTGDWAAPAGEAQPFSASLDFSWELDLFGGGQRQEEAADARLAGSAASWHNARVSMAAEVANTYLAARKCYIDRTVGESEVASRAKTVAGLVAKYEAGVLSGADLARGEGALADAQASLAQVRGVCERQVNSLVALTGLSASTLREKLEALPAEVPQPQWSSFADVPATAVAQRPDVRAAEQNLISASASIGVAKAAALPALTLRGSIGRIAVQAGAGLLKFSNPWSFGPALAIPLLDGSSRAGAVDSAKAVYDEALAGYRGAVRQAVQETEDALSRVNRGRERQLAAQSSAKQQDAQFRAASLRFEAGSISGLDREDALRAKLTSTLSRASADLEAAQSWVSLYKALGGGWAPSPANQSTTEEQSQ